MAGFGDLQPAEGGAHHHAAISGPDMGEVDPGMLDRESGGGEDVLDVTAVVAGRLAVHEAGRVEVSDLAADSGGGLRGVEAGDQVDPRPGVAKVGPNLLGVGADGRYEAHSRDRHALLMRQVHTETVPGRARAGDLPVDPRVWVNKTQGRITPEPLLGRASMAAHSSSPTTS